MNPPVNTPPSPSARTTAPARAAILSFIVDAAFVAIFVALGRGSHEREATLLGFLNTAWPFLAALAVTWVAALVWRRPLSVVRAGIPVWIGTAAIGPALRWIVGGGIALPFVIVTVLVLAAFLIGWRLVFAIIARLVRRG